MKGIAEYATENRLHPFGIEEVKQRNGIVKGRGSFIREIIIFQSNYPLNQITIRICKDMVTVLLSLNFVKRENGPHVPCSM